MIHHNQLIRYANRDGVDTRTVKRDYIIAHVLCAIACEPESARMIFKGGTALRMCFFEDYRYSADLDFSLIEGLDRHTARAAVARALPSVDASVGIRGLALDDSSHPRIVYEGPLGQTRPIKLDLADDELVIAHAPRELLPRYPDQPHPVSLDTYTLEEIAAEKLRCIIQRLQCRDLFDLYELFESQHVDLPNVWPAFESKAQHRGIDPTIFAARFEERIHEYRQRWQQEMEVHIGDPPFFNAVERAVRRHLRAQFKRR